MDYASLLLMTALEPASQSASSGPSSPSEATDSHPVRIGFLAEDTVSARRLLHSLHLNATRLGVKVIDTMLLTPRERVEPVAALLRRKIQCLVMLASPNSTWRDSLASCAGAGIPVVSLGTRAHGTDIPQTQAAIECAEYTARSDFMAYACQSFGGRGTVAYLHDGDVATMAFLPAIQSAVAAFPNAVFAPVVRRNTDADVSLLATLPGSGRDVAAIVASTDALALQAVAAFQAGSLAAPPIYGFGGSPQAVVAVDRGHLTATARLDFDALATDAMRAALVSIAGQTLNSQLVVEFQRVTSDNASDVIAHIIRNQADLVDDMARRLEAQSKTTDFLEQVIDILPLNLFVKEAEQLRYMRINKARATWFGIEPEDHIGKSARDLYPPNLAERFEASDREVLAGRRGSLPDEHPTISPRPGADGGLRYVQTNKLAIYDAQGNPQYLVGVTLDVTERKTAELALAQRNEELEAAQLTMQKQQTKLVIAEKMASIGRLTAGIAHEMNTPLAAVRASMCELTALVDEYAEGISDSTVTPDDHREIASEMKAAIGIADKSAARASAFVRGIKSQTRSLSGNPRVAFNAVAVIQESILLLSHALRDANCTATFECSTFDSKRDYVELVGSPASFAQVVTNLVTNAIDASRPVGGDIRLELVSSGDRVSLRVTDHGCGMPPEIIANIFEPMFTTKPFGQGTGLGLSILHDIITGEFDGSVEVHSDVGKGTTFELFLGPSIDRLT